MALGISPFFSSPPDLAPLSSLSLRCGPRKVYYSGRRKRSICRCSSSSSQVQEVLERSPAVLEKQGTSSSSRRQFLAILLTCGGWLPVPKLKNVAAAAATHDVNSETSSVDELQGKKRIDGPIIRDFFGFDGLGKSPEEYVLGKVVALAQAGDGAVLFLGVDGFELPLQLVIGPAEAMAVLTAVQERKSRRPVTHEAWGLSLAAVGWKVDRVVITGNEKDIFYSSVVLSNLSQLLSESFNLKTSVDMRPSDGIALALRCRAPLFVYRKVAEEILGRKEDLAGKIRVDPLKQPGLQANSGAATVFLEKFVSLSRRNHDSSVCFSWIRRLQSL